MTLLYLLKQGSLAEAASVKPNWPAPEANKRQARLCSEI